MKKTITATLSKISAFSLNKKLTVLFIFFGLIIGYFSFIASTMIFTGKFIKETHTLIFRAFEQTFQTADNNNINELLESYMTKANDFLTKLNFSSSIFLKNTNSEIYIFDKIKHNWYEIYLKRGDTNYASKSVHLQQPALENISNNKTLSKLNKAAEKRYILKINFSGGKKVDSAHILISAVV